MKKNIGSVDRTVRIFTGVVMIVAAFVFNGWWWLTGIIPLATGIIGYCPLYVPFGRNTAEGYPFTVGYFNAPPEVKPAKRR